MLLSNLIADLNVVSYLEFFMLSPTSSHIFFGAKNTVKHVRQIRKRISQIVLTQNARRQMIHEDKEDKQKTKTRKTCHLATQPDTYGAFVVYF